MIPVKLAVSGFENLLPVPANISLSRPLRFVMREIQLLAVSVPEEIVHHRATADSAGDADGHTLIQPECPHIKRIVVQRTERQAIVYHARTTVRFPVNMYCFNANQRPIHPQIIAAESTSGMIGAKYDPSDVSFVYFVCFVYCVFRLFRLLFTCLSDNRYNINP